MAAWTVTGMFAVWAALRLVPGDVGFHWVRLVAFTPVVAFCSPVAVAVASLARRWYAAGVAGLVCLVMAALVGPRALPGEVAPPQGPRLRVLSANLLVGSVPGEALVRLVRDLRPDVLALQELTPTAAEALRDAGLHELLPHQAREARPGVGGSGIYSRFPVNQREVIDFGGFAQLRATVEAPGRNVDVVSVHPCAPARADKYRCWADGLAALPPADGDARVLMGDFNATLDHARMRALLATGYRDAADATGDGLATTWPVISWRFHGVPIPSVTLDHVLAGGGTRVHAFSTHVLPGTDHRAVFADLTLQR